MVAYSTYMYMYVCGCTLEHVLNYTAPHEVLRLQLWIGRHAVYNVTEMLDQVARHQATCYAWQLMRYLLKLSVTSLPISGQPFLHSSISFLFQELHTKSVQLVD